MSDVIKKYFLNSIVSVISVDWVVSLLLKLLLPVSAACVWDRRERGCELLPLSSCELPEYHDEECRTNEVLHAGIRLSAVRGSHEQLPSYYHFHGRGCRAG